MWRRAPAQLQTLASSWRSAFGHGGCTVGAAASSSAETLRHRVLATFSSSLHSSPFQRTSPLFSSDADKSDTVSKKRVEDVMPIATGLEREELEAELEGRKRFDMDAPVGPFGTKDCSPCPGLGVVDWRILPDLPLLQPLCSQVSEFPLVEKQDADAWLGLILSAPCFFTDESSERQEAPAVIKSYFDKRIVGCPGGEGEDEHDVVWFWLEKGKPHECPVCSQYFVLEVIGSGGPPDGHGDDDDH